MSAHGFRSLYMAASVAGAALGCYLVSLNVASERAKLEAVEERIVLTQRDIRLLQTEIGTRGRLAQLERWNAKVIRLSAPSADQFVEGGFQLAALVRPQPKPAIEAPVILATAPADQAVSRPHITSDDSNAPVDSTGRLLHTASYSRPAAAVAEQLATPAPPPAADNSKKPVAAMPARSASSDPLAPLPTASTASTAAKGGARKSLPAKPKDASTAQ